MAVAKEPPKQEGKSRMLADVRSLARVLRQYDLAEVEVERDGERIRLSRAVAAAAISAPAVEMPPSASATAVAAAATEATDDGLTVITSPFVGTFYRAPSPESPPFVEVGQPVPKGTTLCIVEAMKLMNEIEAEVDCKIAEILVKNGEPVEFSQALFKVEPT